MRQVREFLLSKAPAGEIRDEMQALFDNVKRWPKAGEEENPKSTEGLNVGLIVSERIVNLPPELAPDLHQALQDDLAWALENEVCCSGCPCEGKHRR